MKDIISWTKFGDLLHAGIQNQFTPAAEQIGCKKNDNKLPKLQWEKIYRKRVLIELQLL